MYSGNNKSNETIGNSIYQRESRNYYDSLRDIHSKVFTNNIRLNAEKMHERYSNGNVTGIKNLYTFIKILVDLMKDRNNVKGVDYGCGSHYFVNDMHVNHGWNIVGFDSDKTAINEARHKYPNSAGRYRVRNLLKNRLPLKSGSRDFVFCNAVIQHFSDEEVSYAFSDISRVLKTGGIFLLIFKRKIRNWTQFSEQSGVEVHIRDKREGKIEIEDEEIKTALEALDDTVRKEILIQYISGMRLLHFFSIFKITKIAGKNNMKVITNLQFANEIMPKAVFMYRSGKNIPNAAIFFFKRK